MGEFEVSLTDELESQLKTGRAIVISQFANPLTQMYMDGEIDLEFYTNGLSMIAETKAELFILGMMAKDIQIRKESELYGE